VTTIRRPRHGAFVSYARADGEAAARALCARLDANLPDVPAWLDRFQVEGGVGWWNQIEQALDRAEFLLLVMTPAAMRSENTRREWRSARQRGVCVYPVKGVPDAELDYPSLPNWMRKAHFYDPQLEWEKLVAHLRRGCTATRVPFMAPSLPLGFVPRRGPAEAVTASLLAVGRPGRAVTALRGPGGFGKTILAAAVCYDERVTDAFDDGILWVTLGQSPNLLNELVKLYAALTGERPGFVDVEDASRELALKLESRTCLLVIDDVWNPAHVKPFLNGGPGCARLITTRLLEVATDVQRIEIEQMTSDEGLQLLLARAGLEAGQADPFRSLVERLGEWPLAIKLAGSAMRQRIERGDTPANALGYVDRALDKRGLTAFDRADASDRTDAVGRTVAASLDLLTPDEQRRCAELAAFPEDTAIPIANAATLWGLDDLDTEECARRLDDLALVDFDLRRATLRLHDVLRGLLRDRLPDEAAVHARLVDAWGDPYQLPNTRAWRDYSYHLVQAQRADALRALLLDLRWLDANLRATDVASLTGDYDYLPADPVLGLVRDALRLSAPALARDPQQLRIQLVGRLLERPEPEIRALRRAAADGAASPALELLHPTLDAPGGMLQITLVGHEGDVTSLAADAGYSRLMSGSDDGTVRVWDLDSGAMVTAFDHSWLGVTAVASSGDASIALSAGADGKLYLCDVVHGAPAAPIRGAGKRSRTAVALSADGGVAVWGSRDAEVIVWDVPSAAVRHVLTGHEDRVTSVAVSADGARAVSGSDDGTIRVWDIATGTLVRTLQGHAGPVNAVAFSADGRCALSGSSDRTIKLWDADQGRCLKTLVGHAASVTCVALAAGGWRAISGSSDHGVRLWNLRDGTALATLDAHTDAVRAVAINDAGTRAATASLDRTIKLWRLDDLRPLAVTDWHAGAVLSLVFSGDGRLCASGGGDGRVTVRDVHTGAPIRSFDAHAAPVRSLAFTQDDTCLLSTGIDGRFWLWTIDDGAAISLPIQHMAAIDDCTFSAKARFMIAACGDQFVYLWDVPSGVRLERYGTRRLFDHLIAASPKRGDLPESDELLDQYLHGEAVYDVTVVRMSADGEYALLSATVRERGALSSAAAHGTPGHRSCVLVFQVASGELRSVTSRQPEVISAFAMDTSASRLLWARADHALELWDLQTEKRLALLRGHDEEVNAVAFSPDGRFAFSCGRDRTLIAWSLDSGERLAAFTADAALRAVAVSPAGDVIAAGDVAGRVHMLRWVAPGAPAAAEGE
jgi:WD40 repeat protein